jgi:outer membrane protein assembly factor BamB
MWKAVAVAAVVAFASVGCAGGSRHADARGANAPCPSAALVSARSGAVVRVFGVGTLPGAYAVADGRGGWFVAGTGGVVRLRADGHVDRGWHADLPRPLLPLWAVTRSRTRLFVTDRFRVIALDAGNGRHLWSSARADTGEYGYRNGIMALAPTGATVFAGGQFGRVGGVRRIGLAALDARTGRVVRWRMPPLRYPHATAYVTVLTAARGRLYIGGNFGYVGRAPRPGIAAVSSRDGRLFPFAPSSVERISSIAVSGRTVFVGGTFTGGAFDAATGKPRPWSRRVAGAGALALGGSTLFLGGDLRSSIAAHNLKAIDIGTGRPREWAPNLARYVSVGTLAVSGGKVFVGGSFCPTIG